MLRSTLRMVTLTVLAVAFVCPQLMAMDFSGRLLPRSSQHSHHLLPLNGEPISFVVQRDTTGRGIDLRWLPIAVSPALRTGEIWRGRTTRQHPVEAMMDHDSLLDLHCQLVV